MKIRNDNQYKDTNFGYENSGMFNKFNLKVYVEKQKSSNEINCNQFSLQSNYKNKIDNFINEVNLNEPELLDKLICINKNTESLTEYIGNQILIQDKNTSEIENQKALISDLDDILNKAKSEYSIQDNYKKDAINLANNLSKNDFYELKSQKNPSNIIIYQIKCIVQLQDLETKAQQEKNKLPQYDIKMMNSNENFQQQNIFRNQLLNDIFSFRKNLISRLNEESISSNQYLKLKKLQNSNYFEETYLNNCVKSIKTLALWIKAMYNIQISNIEGSPILNRILNLEKKLSKENDILEKLYNKKYELYYIILKTQNDIDYYNKEKIQTNEKINLISKNKSEAKKFINNLQAGSIPSQKYVCIDNFMNELKI